MCLRVTCLPLVISLFPLFALVTVTIIRSKVFFKGKCLSEFANEYLQKKVTNIPHKTKLTKQIKEMSLQNPIQAVIKTRSEANIKDICAELLLIL